MGPLQAGLCTSLEARASSAASMSSGVSRLCTFLGFPTDCRSQHSLLTSSLSDCCHHSKVCGRGLCTIPYIPAGHKAAQTPGRRRRRCQRPLWSLSTAGRSSSETREAQGELRSAETSLSCLHSRKEALPGRAPSDSCLLPSNLQSCTSGTARPLQGAWPAAWLRTTNPCVEAASGQRA